MYDREIKQRLSEGKAERVRALPSVSCFDRRSNIVNPAQKEAQTFGYSKDLITLSQVLTANYTLLNIAGARAIIYGFSCKLARRSDCFLPIHL